jgi:hypothetical protein
MYDFIDQRVTSLDNGGRFLIWSMRNWVTALSQQQCPPNAVGPAFAKWGMIGALPHFHMAMMVLSREALQTLKFSPLNCQVIVEDEALMLGLFRSVACDPPDRLRETLELIVDKDAVPKLIKALVAIALHLNNNNLSPELPKILARKQGISTHE